MSDVGVMNAVSKFQHKAEIRESKDEMLVGEMVRAMSRMDFVADQFVATEEWQRVRFRSRGDEVLSYVFLVLDRKTGGGRISGAVLGSKATMTVAGQVKNMLSDPDDVVNMWKTDFKNIAKIGLKGQVKVNHELNSVVGKTTDLIEIDNYVLKGDEGVARLTQHLEERIGRVRDALREYKKPTR